MWHMMHWNWVSHQVLQEEGIWSEWKGCCTEEQDFQRRSGCVFGGEAGESTQVRDGEKTLKRDDQNQDTGGPESRWASFVQRGGGQKVTGLEGSVG